jgi:sec-independent protein translocase protein TatC
VAASTALRRPVSHDARLSLVDHLDELRSRLVICLVALVVLFGLCLWQNDRLLSIVNHPLTTQTQKQINTGKGTLGGIAKTQASVKALAANDRAALAVLVKPGSGLSADARAALQARIAALDQTIKNFPPQITGNKPVTLGIGEPFTMTLAVAAMFSLLLAMPIILYQLYAFIIPAFTKEERKSAVPLLSLIPFLFCAGVAFGYFLVLPPAVKFLQNFNTDEFNVLVQARDYYKFVALTLVSCGIVFQVPVGILALTRLGVLNVGILRKNRRYAIVACAVIAMVLPGTDPVTTLILMAPLVLLYELSILLAVVFKPKRDSWATDEDDHSDEPDLDD